MKSMIIVIIVAAILLGCNGDVSESRNHRLPLSTSLTLPSLPVQSLQPPTFENPIKDYTVGLVPPPVDNQLTKTLSAADYQHHQHHLLQAPPHQHTSHYGSRFIAPSVPSKVVLQQRLGSPHEATHHYTHHSTIPLQPQVYQPKTVVHQQYQQPSIHHHNHHNHHPKYQPSSYITSSVLPQTIQQQSHHISVSTPVDYYRPITHHAVHQHSGPVYYASAPVHRVKAVAEHIYPSPQHSTVVPPSDVRIIQTYPSVSHAANLPQHGSTLRLGSDKLEPELVYIISEVLHRYHL